MKKLILSIILAGIAASSFAGPDNCVQVGPWTPRSGLCDSASRLEGAGSAQFNNYGILVIGEFKAGILQPGEVRLDMHPMSCKGSFAGEMKLGSELLCTSENNGRFHKWSLKSQSGFSIDPGWRGISGSNVEVITDDSRQNFMDRLLKAIPYFNRSGLSLTTSTDAKGRFSAPSVKIEKANFWSINIPIARGELSFNYVIGRNDSTPVKVAGTFSTFGFGIKSSSNIENPNDDVVTIDFAGKKIIARKAPTQETLFSYYDDGEGFEFDAFVEQCRKSASSREVGWIRPSSVDSPAGLRGCGRLSRPGNSPIIGFFYGGKLERRCEDGC